MARPLRLETPGGVYHLTARGNERKPIYVDADDRHLFLGTLDQVVSRYGWICLAYCQMGNHYHLLVETPLPNLSRGMRQLNGVYAQRFNRRHRRVGHLFQARYHASLVQRDAHLHAAAAYILANPVRAGLCERAEQWRWSSHRATLGLEPAPPFLHPDALLAYLADTRDSARAALHSLVEQAGTSGRQTGQPEVPIHGDDEFRAAQTAALEPLSEVPRRHWQPVRPPLERLLAADAPDALARAYREYGYTMREIAERLGVHYTTVSRRLRRLEAAAVSERKT